MLDVAMVFAIGGNPAERRGFLFYIPTDCSIYGWFFVRNQPFTKFSEKFFCYTNV